MNLKLRVLFVGLMSWAGTALADPSAIVVPEGEYTLLTFGQPVARAVLAPDAPISGKPYYMSGNRTIVIRFKASKKPVQLVTELQDGSTRILYLQPTPGAQAAVTVNGTSIPGPAQAQAEMPAPSRNPGAGSVNILSSILSGITPAGWTLVQPSTVPKLLYDRVTATPVGVWQATGEDEILVQYRLEAKRGLESVVDPSQFYRPGVVAALLSDSHVSATQSPFLYVIAKVH